MSGDEKVLLEEHYVGMHTPFRDPRAQIRLIHFNPKESGDNISASLETWDIKFAPPYNAISYASDEPSDPHISTINGTHIPVLRNCFHALRQAFLHYPHDYSICGSTPSGSTHSISTKKRPKTP
jgi:hypothetical protein